MTIKKKALQYGLVDFIAVIVKAFVLLPGITKNHILNNSKELIRRQVFMDKLSV